MRVSKETAILLKEAGYNVATKYYYGLSESHVSDKFDARQWNSMSHRYSAPILHEAADWLRSKGVHVWVMYSGKKGWIYGVAELDNTVYGVVDKYFETFEAAYEAGIVHGLKYIK